jgi:DNA-binding beta-propeller fold protein YncE
MQVVWSYANQRRAVMRMIRPTHIRVTLAGIGIAAAVSVTPLAPAQAAATDGHGAALRPAIATEIPLAHLPRSIAADPLTGMIYVSEFGGELQVINGRTNSVVASLPLPGRVPFVAVDPLTGRVYVTGGTHVLVIDARTNKVVAKIRLSGSFLATDPLTDRIYVQAYVSLAAGKLGVIDGRTNKVVAAIPDANGSWGVAVDPLANTVYAGGSADSLWVIDGRTSKVTATVPAVQGSDIATNPLTHTVYVPDPHTDAGGQTFVIDGRTNKVTTSVPGAVPIAADTDPLNNLLYVVNTHGGFLGTPGLLSVIDGRTNVITANVKLSGTPYDVAVDPLTNNVYVAMANKHASWVSVLSGSR